VVPVGIFLHRDRCHNIRSRIAGGVLSEARWYLRGPYAITVGQPTHFEGDAENHEHIRRISETLMDKIQHLTIESERRIHGRKPVTSPI
jgi:hypothetical protein